jgi:hypothetical protein
MADELEGLMRKLDLVVSYAEVGAFVKNAMGPRLDERRELVTRALSESKTRESQRLLAAIPIDVDGEAAPHSGASSWGSISESGQRPVVRVVSITTKRVVLFAAAVLSIVLTTVIAMRTLHRPAPIAGTALIAEPAPSPPPVETSAVAVTPITIAPAASEAKMPPPAAKPFVPVMRRAPRSAKPTTAKPRDDEAGF